MQIVYTFFHRVIFSKFSAMNIYSLFNYTILKSCLQRYHSLTSIFYLCSLHTLEAPIQQPFQIDLVLRVWSTQVTTYTSLILPCRTSKSEFKPLTLPGSQDTFTCSLTTPGKELCFHGHLRKLGSFLCCSSVLTNLIGKAR